MADFIQHAYTATGRSAFQYTTLLGQQQLVVCSDKLIAELGQAPADTINFRAWSKEVFTCHNVNWDEKGGPRGTAGGTSLTALFSICSRCRG